MAQYKQRLKEDERDCRMDGWIKSIQTGFFFFLIVKFLIDRIIQRFLHFTLSLSLYMQIYTFVST
jgi:hypothetical protein